MNIAFQTPDIHLYCLPPKTTHKLQPLDVGIFGPTQTAWGKRCDEIAYLTGEGVPLSDIVKEYMTIRETVFTPDLISKAFERTGINPLNKDIFTAADYAPSLSTSVLGEMPSTYPPARSSHHTSVTDGAAPSVSNLDARMDGEVELALTRRREAPQGGRHRRGRRREPRR